MGLTINVPEIQVRSCFNLIMHGIATMLSLNRPDFIKTNQFSQLPLGLGGNWLVSPANQSHI